MFYFCRLNYSAVPPYVVPMHDQCIQKRPPPVLDTPTKT